MKGSAARSGPKEICSLFHRGFTTGSGSGGVWSMIPVGFGNRLRFHAGLLQNPRRVLQLGPTDLVLGQIGPGPHSTRILTDGFDPGWVWSRFHVRFGRLSVTPTYPGMQHPFGVIGDGCGPRPPCALAVGRGSARTPAPPRDPARAPAELSRGPTRGAGAVSRPGAGRTAPPCPPRRVRPRHGRPLPPRCPGAPPAAPLPAARRRRAAAPPL